MNVLKILRINLTLLFLSALITRNSANWMRICSLTMIQANGDRRDLNLRPIIGNEFIDLHSACLHVPPSPKKFFVAILNGATELVKNFSLQGFDKCCKIFQKFFIQEVSRRV